MSSNNPYSPLITPPTKEDAVNNASVEKQNILTQRVNPLSQQELIQQNADSIRARQYEQAVRESDSWVTDEGLDSFGGTVANSVAAAVEIGVPRLLSQTLGLLPNAVSAMQIRGVPDAAIESYNKQMGIDGMTRELDRQRRLAMADSIMGTLSADDYQNRMAFLDQKAAEIPTLRPEENALLDQVLQQDEGPSIDEFSQEDTSAPAGNPVTYRSKLNAALRSSNAAAEIDKFFMEDTIVSGIFNDSSRKDLISEIETAWNINSTGFDKADAAEAKGNYGEATWEGVKTLAGLIADGGSAIASNPGASVEYAMENAPRLLTGLFGKSALALTNTGYAMDTYRRGLEAYQSENNGNLPDKDTQGKMLMSALAAGGVEMVADSALLKAAGLGKAAPNPTQTLKGALLSRATTPVTSGIGEGVTEGIQTGLEQLAEGKSLDEIDGGEVYAGAVIGTAAGGATTVPGSALGAVGDTVRKTAIEPLQKRAIKAAAEQQVEDAKNAEIDEAINTAIGTKVPSPVIKSTSEGENQSDFAISDVLSRIAARHKSVTQPSEEGSEPNLEEGKKLVTAARQTMVAARNKAEQVSDQIDALDKQYEGTELPADVAEQRESLIREEESLQAEVSDNAQAFKDLVAAQNSLTSTEEDVNTVVNATEQTQQFKIAKQQIIDKTLSSMESVTVEQVRNVLDKASTLLSEEERNQLENYAETKERLDAAKSVDEVNQLIIEGGTDTNGRVYKGAEEYRDEITLAVQTGDTRKAQMSLIKLREFTERHRAKANAFKKAFAPYARARTQASKLAPTKEELDAKQYVEENFQTQSGKAYDVGFNFGSIAQATVYEASALEATLREAEALVQTKKIDDVTTETETAADPLVTEDTSTTPDANQVVEEASQSPQQTEELIPEEQAAETLQEPTSSQQETNSQEGTVDENISQTSNESAVSGLVRPISDESIELSADQKVEQINIIDRSFKVKNIVGSVLHGMQNLAETLAKSPQEALKYLEIDSLTTKQEAAVAHFAAFVPQVSEALSSIFEPSKFTVRNYMNNLVNEDGSLRDGVTEAIAATVYNWAATRSTDTYYNDKQAIANMLSLPESKVTEAMIDLLGDKGVSRAELVRQLGAEVRKTLGLDVKDGSVPLNHKDNLEQALGTYAYGVLFEMGMIEESAVPRIWDVGSNKRKVLPMTRTKAKMVDGVLTETESVKEIVDVNRGTSSIIGKMFKSEMVRTEPRLVAPEDQPGRQKGTFKSVTAAARRILTRHANRAHQIASEVDGVFNLFNREQQEALVGVVDSDGLENTHKANRKGVEGKNASLRRELDDYSEWRGRMEEEGSVDTEFYLEHEIWRNQRIGMSTGLINPQASKVQRGLVRMSNWVKTIKLDNKKHMDMFKLGFGQGMGIDVDKLTIPESIAEVSQVLESETVQKALAALNLHLNGGELTVEMRDDIVAAVRMGGEGTHSLNALVNYARYQDAVGKGMSGFKSDMVLEVDGITNGVMIGVMQFMPGSEKAKELLAAGGIFTDGTTSYGEWRSKGNIDNYENLATAWLEKMRERFVATEDLQEKKQFAVIANILQITKNGKPNRKLAKAPLMTNVYGASADSIKALVGDEFIDAIYKRIEDIVNDPELWEDERRDQLMALQNELNQLTSEPLLNFGKFADTRSALDALVNPVAEAEIRDMLSNSFGEELLNAVEEKFGDFMERRSKFNSLIEKQNKVFTQLFDKLVEIRTQELIEQGVISGKYETLPQNEIDLIIDKLMPIMPSLDTVYAQNEYQNMQLTSMEKGSASSDPKAKVEVTLANGKKITTYARKRGFREKLGVGSAILGIHSMDAAVALSTMRELDILNVHDGFSTSVVDAQKLAKLLNNRFVEAMKRYSIVEAGNASAIRAEEAIMEIMTEYDLTTRDIPASKDFYSQEFTELSQVTQTEKAKLLDEITYVTQYNLEESGQTNEAPKAADVTADRSEWGSVYTGKKSARKRPMTAAEDYLRNNDNPTVGGLVDLVMPFIDKRSAIARVLGTLGAALDTNLNFALVEPNTNLDSASEEVRKAIKDSHALYDGNTHTVYLKSSAFSHHGMNAETIAHELMHALASRYIQDNPDAEAVQELEELRQQVLKDLDSKPNLFGEKPPQISNVDELLAWGMTNETFQSYLKSLRVKPREGKVVTGFKRFVNLLQKIMFGKEVEGATNTAMYQLIESGAQIMSDARQYKPAELDYSVAPQKAQTMSSIQMLEQLGLRDTLNTRTQAHKSHLAKIQASVLDILAGPFHSTLRDVEDSLGDDVDQMIRHLQNKTTPFVSGLVGKFNLSAQEAYVSEQVEAVLGELLNTDSRERKQLTRLWQLAKNSEEVRNALTEEQWNYIFNPRTTSVITSYNSLAGKSVTRQQSDYLQRFAALSLTHAPLRDAMSGMNVNAQSLPVKGKSFGKQIEAIWHNLLEYVRKLMDRASNVDGPAQERIDRILQNLAVIEHRKRQRIEADIKKAEAAQDNPLNKAIHSATATIKRKMRNTRKGTISRAADVASRMTEEGVADGFADVMQKVRNRITSKRNGLVMSLVQELRGETEGNSRFMKLLRWSNRDIDQARRQVKEAMTSLVLEGFEQELTKEESSALTKAIIMTDMVSLFDNPKDISKAMAMLEDPSARSAMIEELESQLAQTEYGMFYVNQADALGMYMAQGRATNTMLIKNAHGIARLFGRPETASDADIKMAEPLIDQLATLYAINYTNADQRNAAINMLNKDRAGVYHAMFLHKQLKKEALESAFDGDPALMAKGYTYEITNPHKTVAWAEKGSDEAALLEAQGYVLDHETVFAYDRRQPNPVGVYVLHDGGTARYMASIMSNTNLSAKGSSLANVLAQGDGKIYHTVKEQQDGIAAQRANDSRLLLSQRVKPNPDVVYGIPVFNPDGKAVDFRLEMLQHYREQTLEKDYRLEHVLGGEAGNLVDKQSSEAVNSDTIVALAEAYKADSDKGEYITISKNPGDARLKEIWDMLPEAAKQRAQDEFGAPMIKVRREMLDLVFGYRKFSVLDSLKVPANERTRMQRMMATALELAMKYFGIKAATRIQQAEQVWQEIIRAVKDILVVKNLFTLVGNIVSNIALLSLSGVPIRDIIRNKAIAWKGVQDYQRDKNRLFKLEQTIAAQPLTAEQLDEFQAEIAIINQRMAINPVAELVEAGIFQTIVEDIDTADDPYSYKSKLVTKMDEYTKHVPQGIKEAAKVMTMSHDTSVYKFMNQSTQISDFAARYVQYKYFTERAKNPLTKEEALKRVVENFVNYDIPTHKGVQYLNDMGVVMFTKYYMRIQKPLVRMVGENPARFMMMLMAQSFLGFSAPSDSSFLTNNPLSRFVNPLNTIVGAPDEIMLINGVLHGTGIK